MARIAVTNNVDIALSTDCFTFRTNFLNRCFYFHCVSKKNSVQSVHPNRWPYYTKAVFLSTGGVGNYPLWTILPLPPYGSISTRTVSPINTRIRLSFIFPDKYARVSTSSPSSRTRKSVSGKASVTTPFRDSFSLLFWLPTGAVGIFIDTDNDSRKVRN